MICLDSNIPGLHFANNRVVTYDMVNMAEMINPCLKVKKCGKMMCAIHRRMKTKKDEIRTWDVFNVFMISGTLSKWKDVIRYTAI